jgi:hypothetical protein
MPDFFFFASFTAIAFLPSLGDLLASPFAGYRRIRLTMGCSNLRLAWCGIQKSEIASQLRLAMTEKRTLE